MKIRLLVLAFALGASAQHALAQKTYKWVDEKGVVNYGPVPPAPEKAAKINTAPALTTRDDNCTGRNCYDSGSDSSRYREQTERYQDAQRARQEQITSTQSQRRNQLRADCERNRGTDCNNPATLRDMESATVPRTRNY